MLGSAIRAPADVTAAPQGRAVTAHRAEPVTVVPVQQRPRLRDDARLVPAQESRSRPRVDEPQRVVAPEPRRRAARRRNEHREVRDPVPLAEKHRPALVDPEALHILIGQPVQRAPALIGHRHVQLRHHQESAARVDGPRGQPPLVPPLPVTPVQRIPRKNMRPVRHSCPLRMLRQTSFP